MYIIAFVTLVPRLLFDFESLCDFSDGINSGAYRTGNIFYLTYRDNNQIIILIAKVLNRIIRQEIILFTVTRKAVNTSPTMFKYLLSGNIRNKMFIFYIDLY